METEAFPKPGIERILSEKHEDRIAFSDVDLSRLEWMDAPLSDNPSWSQMKQEATVPFLIQSSVFELHGVREVGMVGKGGDAVRAEQYQFTIESPETKSSHKTYLRAEIGFFQTADGWRVEDLVEKIQQHEALRGMGREFWKKMLELIKTFSKTKGKVIHELEMELEVGQSIKLTQSEWDTLFVKELDERGYRRIDQTHWTKTYGR